MVQAWNRIAATAIHGKNHMGLTNPKFMMNRVGLFVALSVALIAGIAFGVFPQIDLWLAHLFYNPGSRTFLLSPVGIAQVVRRAAMWIAWAFTAPAIVTLIVKFIRPEKPLLISGRAVAFLLSTILITAILLPDVTVKHHWGRPRPIATIQFNGSQEFKPWWQARTGDWHNTSFFSGEAATAFWTYAPAALAPPAVRPLAFIGATIFGLTTGILRMAFGAHYASDVLAAGVTAFLVVWLGHGLIYRWKILGVTDDEIDRFLTEKGIKLRSAKAFWLLASVVGVLTIARLVALKFSSVDLFPDEARYWWWSRTPAFGYFSKPPLIAWIIAVVTNFCGNSEAGVRAAAPIYYASTALVGFFIARHLYGERVGLWSGLCLTLATGVVYSARIVSTDVALLFFWTVALLAYLKMIGTRGYTWSVVLGLALGFGMLAKYAMIYFVLSIVAVSLIDPAARALWRQLRFWFALAIALLLVSPNLIWNATHHFTTFHYTWRNIVGNGLRPNLLGPLAFLGAQFGVFGPVAFATFLLVLIIPSRFDLVRADRILIAFALPALAIVSVGAVLTSAEANWAAPSGISLIIVTTALLVRQQRWRWLQISLAIGIGLQIVLAGADAFADRVSLGLLAKPDVYHRTMGWKALASLVRQRASETGSRSVGADQPDTVFSLRYYLRADSLPILSESEDRLPGNDFAQPVLYLSSSCLPQGPAHYHLNVETLAPIDAPTGPRSSRHYCVFKLTGEGNTPESLTTAPH
jgi:membrane-associated phospholipid phosphatase